MKNAIVRYCMGFVIGFLIVFAVRMDNMAAWVLGFLLGSSVILAVEIVWRKKRERGE